MCMCAPEGIFQAKVDKRFGYIKGIKTYTNDKLLLIKYYFSKHIDQIRAIIVRLSSNGLKVDKSK